MSLRFFAFLFSFYFFIFQFSCGYAHEQVLAGNVDGQKSFSGARPDGHAPSTIMGDHVHKKGEWMLSYRYMQMRMSGNIDGHHSLSNADVLRSYMVVPTSMMMQSHMLGLMLAPSDFFTLTAMLPFIRKDMEQRNRMGNAFRTHASGIGDVKISGLVSFFNKNRHHAHLNLGMSFPTGSIDEKHDTPMGTDRRLGYSMQLGSGTWDFLPGVTYTGQTDNWSWGAQQMMTLRPGRNHIGYSLGNRYETAVWGARKWTAWFSNSAGLKYSIWQNIGGRDPLLNPAMASGMSADSQGGKRIDLLFGINLYAPKGILKGQRLAIDFGIPVMESLDGPRLETDWYFTTGWQASFG